MGDTWNGVDWLNAAIGAHRMRNLPIFYAFFRFGYYLRKFCLRGVWP